MSSSNPDAGESPALTIFEDHFRNPRHTGVLDDPAGKIEVENPVCGDLLVLYWRASPAGEIEAARFQVYGCPAAIASGSLLTDLILNSDTATLAAITAEEIDARLGGLGQSHFHAAVLAADALGELLKAIRE